MSTITLGATPLVRIVHPPEAGQPVRRAAGELRDYLKASLGGALETVEGSAEPGAFFVTTAQLSPAAFAAAGPFPADEHDRCAAFGQDGCVILVGENPLSAQYAVYDFLQAYLGIRFFAPGSEHEHVPVRSSLRLDGDFVFRRGSRFAIRNWVNRTNDPEAIRFAVKSRINTVLGCGPWNPSLSSEFCNAENADLVRAHGLKLRGPGHAWRHFLPDESLFAGHPEYFAVIDGQRTVNGRTACFSNPAVRDIFRTNLRRFLRENPYWDIFAFWAEDLPDPYYCACDECRKLTLCDWYVILANEAAEVVAEELPDAVFELIAYHGTRVPPQQVRSLFRNGETMLLNLCLGYSRDLYRPFASGTPGNAEVHAMYRAWRDYLAAADYRGQTMVMEYYNLCEMPNQGPNGRALLWPMDIIREDTRFYLQDGIDGLGAFAGVDRLCWPSPFNLWCWLKLWNDPDLTVESLEDDFFPAYFGAAAPVVRQYMDRLQRAMRAITCADNVATVRALGEELDAIRRDPDDPQLAQRLECVGIHHEYCVLLKEIFLAYLADRPETWEALAEPYATFFERHRRQLQEHITPFPPLWSDTWIRSRIRPGFRSARLSRDQLIDRLR